MKELDFHAKQDSLTGVFNRRFFNDFLEKEIERSKRYNHEFCILMLDLDKFKGINDLCGHLFGDDVLIGVARILKQKTRQGDIVTHLGGDEFAIILPETNNDGAHVVAEEIKMAISKQSFSTEHNFQVTASIGVISYPTQGLSIKELLSNVDTALYQAKAKGRNVVCDYQLGAGGDNNVKKINKVK
ncbi:MAG: GGDEF domain-containing protein [Methylococcaceae bacterium]|nr:GGDEF domain-containing protein [Methylococcaceae bacterium]